MPKPSINDPVSKKSFDSVSGKVFGANGKVVSDVSAKRKDLIEDLYNNLQSTIGTKLSGVTFSSKLDMLENVLYDLEIYADSLYEASYSIVTNYPSEDDAALTDINHICSVLKDGVSTVKQYLDAIRSFSNDLENIKSEIYIQTQNLYQEI